MTAKTPMVRRSRLLAAFDFDARALGDSGRVYIAREFYELARFMDMTIRDESLRRKVLLRLLEARHLALIAPAPYNRGIGAEGHPAENRRIRT